MQFFQGSGSLTAAVREKSASADAGRICRAWYGACAGSMTVTTARTFIYERSLYRPAENTAV
jgi:hypothetical protein